MVTLYSSSCISLSTHLPKLHDKVNRCYLLISDVICRRLPKSSRLYSSCLGSSSIPIHRIFTQNQRCILPRLGPLGRERVCSLCENVHSNLTVTALFQLGEDFLCLIYSQSIASGLKWSGVTDSTCTESGII